MRANGEPSQAPALPLSCLHFRLVARKESRGQRMRVVGDLHKVQDGPEVPVERERKSPVALELGGKARQN